MPELDFEVAVHRLQSCYLLKESIRDELLLGENGKQAVPRLNPNRVTVEYLEPPVVELRRAIIQLEEVIAEYGTPGENLLGAWYWSGQDDIKRLRARVDFYQEALNYSKSLAPEQQREYLYEYVFLPIFFGSRHKTVGDPNTPWVHTLDDFCEPARIYKNYVYATQLNDATTGLMPFLNSLWDVTVGYFESMEEFGSRIGRGVEKVATFAKKAALPVGVLLAGVGVYMLARKQS